MSFQELWAVLTQVAAVAIWLPVALPVAYVAIMRRTLRHRLLYVGAVFTFAWAIPIALFLFVVMLPAYADPLIADFSMRHGLFDNQSTRIIRSITHWFASHWWLIGTLAVPISVGLHAALFTFTLASRFNLQRTVRNGR
jgi:Ni/Fe-hydrogenase subunit HybB-like protein